MGLSLTELAMLVHDLRTPILSILGLNDIAETVKDDIARTEARERIDMVAHHMLGIVNDILFVAKNGQDTIKLERAPVSSPRLLGDVLAMVQPDAEARQVKVSLVMDYDLPLEFTGDPQRLRQILINLLSNAVRFSPPGATVKLRAGLQLPQALLVFSIEDEGPGLSTEEIKTLFRPFHQIQRISGSTGSGLGLTVCHHLVQIMGGSIDVQSILGKGSQFSIRLPYCSNHSGSAADPVTQQKQSAGEHNCQAPLRILVVDDNPIVNDITSQVARREGHIVESVQSGTEALSALSRSRFDLVLLDQNMDDMDGVETARRIRSMHCVSNDLKIIGLTAHLSSELVSAAKQAGMNDCLQKTARPQEMIALISRAFQRH